MSDISVINQIKGSSDEGQAIQHASTPKVTTTCLLPPLERSSLTNEFKIAAPLVPSLNQDADAPQPELSAAKTKQIAEIFGDNNPSYEYQNHDEIESFMAAYCYCEQPQLGGWAYPPMDVYGQFHPYGFISGQYFEMENEGNLKQKEEMYYKLLENYSYEKMISYDVDKAKEIVALKCTYDGCDKIFNKPWNLLDHMHIHEGVKPHLCEWCGKTFTQRGNLK